MTTEERVTEGLRSAGLHVERRPVAPLRHLLITSVGGLAGRGLGMAAGFGVVGQGLLALLGSITAHVALTHRIVPERADGAASTV